MDEYEVEIVGGAEVKPDATPSSVPNDTPSETPAEAPKDEQPKEETPAEEPTPEQQLFELPDGRKVPAEAVVEEYKKLNSDYTRKSQELAKLKGSEEPNNIKSEEPKWKDPEWQPQTYEEIIQAAKEEIYRDIEQKQQAEREQEKILADQIDFQMAEVKKIDPNVNENRLFEHAVKYKIPDLVSAYQNMKDFDQKIAAIREETVKNVQKRASTPVAGDARVVTPDDGMDVYDPSVRTRSAVEYLRSLKQ